MIDPLLSLSFNLHAHKGTYALLLGSGVSRSAQIPTGWEVTLELIDKLAHLQNEDCTGRQLEWFQEKYAKSPDYAEILSEIASTPAAQQQLLKEYFEPSSEDREEGRKSPTDAHKNIASLVNTDHIRVVVTTNFDRLLESALEAQGIQPIVISSTDDIVGAPPLHHSRCTIVKVHGDYLDSRLKNSPDDLAKFDPELNRLLDRIFDEYGLIVAGWSAEYDIALRNSIKRIKSRRYPMYWTAISDPPPEAKRLIAHQGASLIHISNADQFFQQLTDHVAALAEFSRPHPLSVQAAVTSLKRYLSTPSGRIRARDLLLAEGEKAVDNLIDQFDEIRSMTPNAQSFSWGMKTIESTVETLVHLFLHGSFYSDAHNALDFGDVFESVATRPLLSNGPVVWIDFARYPSLLLTYAIGISALASKNLNVLSEIANRKIRLDPTTHQHSTPPQKIQATGLISHGNPSYYLPSYKKTKLPINEYLCDYFRDLSTSILPRGPQFERHFDNFEYLWSLLYADAELFGTDEFVWVPVGRFIYTQWSHKSAWLREEVDFALTTDDDDYYLLQSGLFGGIIERLESAAEKADPKLDEIAHKSKVW